MAHGGKRDGAGRKPGAVTQKTRDIAEAIMADGGLTPLEYLTSIYRDPAADEAKRIDCAKAAAPYVHAKLNSIEGRIDGEFSVTEVGWVIRAKPGD
jgi:hypothetical protein